jgi:periplasmic mercuric ion binding protein
MKSVARTLITLSSTLTLAATVWAAPRTAILDVPGMTCPTCPITVKKALNKVSGVTKVDVSFEKKQAAVTYDDAKTNVEALLKATADAGYPSKLEPTGKQ